MQETQEMQVLFLGQEDPLDKEMATHSSILAWRIPWTEEPGWGWQAGRRLRAGSLLGGREPVLGAWRSQRPCVEVGLLGLGERERDMGRPVF